MGQFYAFMAVLAVTSVAILLGFLAMAKYKPTPMQMRPWMMGIMTISTLAMCLVLRLPVVTTMVFVTLMAIAAVIGAELAGRIDAAVERRKRGDGDQG